MAARPQPLEHRRQVVANHYLDYALPPGAVVTAIDHGVKSSAAAWQRMQARGVRPGIADWYVLWNGKTLWAEQKAPGGPIQDTQIVFGQNVTRNGAAWGVFVTIDELHGLLIKAGIPASQPRDYDAQMMGATVSAPQLKVCRNQKPRAKKPTLRQIAKIEALRSRILF